jgi:hypothetical protein
VGQNNTDALVIGLRTLAAQRKLEKIHSFSKVIAPKLLKNGLK